MLLQREMNSMYALERFKQELARLRFFYLQRSAKNRTSGKIFTKLNELDLTDEATLARVKEAMADYRLTSRLKYQLHYQELIYNQHDVMMGHVAGRAEGE